MTYEEPGKVERVEVIRIGNGARVGLYVTVITLLLQLATLIWGAATMFTKVSQLEAGMYDNRLAIQRLSQQVNSMDRTLGQVEVKLSEHQKATE